MVSGHHQQGDYRRRRRCHEQDVGLFRDNLTIGTCKGVEDHASASWASPHGSDLLAEALSSGKQQPAFCGQIVHRFYLLGGLTLDGFDEALVKLGVETQHVSYVIEEPVE